MAALTKSGRSSAAGACVLWKERGTPLGRYVWTKCVMYFSCVSETHFASADISTFRRSEMGPSSSTFQRVARSVVKLS
eukprot:2935385-Pleurochrysis_carterae.AAC.1